MDTTYNINITHKLKLMVMVRVGLTNVYQVPTLVSGISISQG
jgi:hypothetical protein